MGSQFSLASLIPENMHKIITAVPKYYRLCVHTPSTPFPASRRHKHEFINLNYLPSSEARKVLTVSSEFSVVSSFKKDYYLFIYLSIYLDRSPATHCR